MAYGYYGRGYSYESPSPKDMDNAGVEDLIKILKAAIDDEKLKDSKSALSKLKLSINREYPLFTQESATFGAYLYAVNNNKKKSADSFLKAALKKKYQYDGIPLLTLVTNLSKQDMTILIKDFFSNPDSQWNLEGSQTIREMMHQFPKETEQFIVAGRLNKFEKGDARVESTLAVISEGSDVSILGALNTFFGMDYVLQYGINTNKLEVLISAVRERPKDIQKKIMTEYFYKVAIKDMHYSMVEADFKNGFLDDTMITNYALILFRKSLPALMEVLNNIKDVDLRSKMIVCNDEITAAVTAKNPDLLPQVVQDIFLF